MSRIQPLLLILENGERENGGDALQKKVLYEVISSKPPPFFHFITGKALFHTQRKKKLLHSITLQHLSY